MFDNIVANNEINFNELEKKIYKFVCKLGCNLIKEIIEKYDEKLRDARDKKKFRNRGLRGDTVKTVMGEIEYKRTIYEYNENEETKFTYLLDEKLKLYEFGKISSNLVDKILNMVVETNSYRDAATQLMQCFSNLSISHETVRDIVIKSGIKIIEKENEEIELYEENKLEAGKKEIPALFEEADGLWINLQGKDRKEQIEKYKEKCEKEGKEYKEPTSVKSELKLHVSYEGWKKDDRHELVNKQYITGFMSPSDIKKLRNAQIYQSYAVDKIELRVLNGDGANWINQLATKDTITQKDNFHIHQEIIRNIQEESYRRQLERLIAESRYDEIPVYLEFLKYELRR